MELREEKLPCWDVMRAVNLFSLAVVWFLMAVINTVLSDIWTAREVSVGVNFCWFSSPPISVFSRRISPSNSRMPPMISSCVAILSQFSPIYKSSNARNVKSGFPKCEESVQKTMLSHVIPSEMGINIKIVEKIDPLTDSEEINQKCRKNKISTDNGRSRRRFVPCNLSKPKLRTQ